MKNLYSKRNYNFTACKQTLLFSISILLTTVLLAQPVISSFSPTSGPIGTTVTINGSNFSAKANDNIVYFGGVKATILSATTIQVVVTVPAGATYQPITVTTNRLTAYSNQPFTVTAPMPYNGIAPSAFSSKTDFPLSGYPNYIISGDIDGDGKNDLLTLNLNANTMSVFRNTGGGGILSLAPAINYAAGSHPFGAALGDLNGDGKTDVVIGNFDSSRIIVYKNAGAPGTILFSKEIEFASGDNPISIGIMDFDLDGKPDIAAANLNGNSVSVFKNMSTVDSIQFSPKRDFAVGNWTHRLTINDFNSDGKPDIAVVNHNDSTLSILKNTSSAGIISFASKVDLGVRIQSFQANSADLNGDGKPEIITANSKSGNISIYKNISISGNVEFSPKIDFTTGDTFSTVIGDLDGDGKPDIVAVNFSNYNISVLRNTSVGSTISFDPKIDYPTGMFPRIASITDLNGDGQPDISVVNSVGDSFSIFLNSMRTVPIIKSFSPTSGSTDSVIMITGQGFSTVTDVRIGGVPVASYTTTPTSIRAIIGSGATGDVVVTTTTGSAVMPGFTFVTPAPMIKSFAPESGTAGSSITIKGKNFRQISSSPVVYFGAVKALISNATDTTLTVTVPTGGTYMPITVTVNGLTAYSSNPFKITFPGTGSGLKASSFTTKKNFATGGNPRSIAIADFDGDGKSDLFISNQSSATASIFRNTSTSKNISLAARQDLPMEAEPFGISTGDFDGDGKTDLAISNANSGNPGSVSIRRNTSTIGSLSFAENITIPVGSGPRGVSITDLNADGKPDLIVTAGNSGIIAIFKNTSDSVGHISFAPQINITALLHADHITSADLDGDGKPEIISANFSGNSMSIWRNTSSGSTISFATPISYAAGSMPVAVCAGDFDNDGKTDIAVANYSSNTVSVFKNNSIFGNISFTNKQDYATGTEPRFITAGDIDGDGKTDIIIPCNTPSAVAVLRNTSSIGNLSFADRIEYITGVQPPSAFVGDLDGDSKPEIIAPNDYSSIAILRNRIDEPLISSFTPTAAKLDSLVTIKGENFGGTKSVSFGGMPASSFTIVADTILTAKVDTGSNGVVQVTTTYGTDTLGLFTYIPPTPLIKSFFPITGTVGTSVRIVGKHFGNATSISFGGIKASSFTVDADSVIIAIVGKGATGNVKVSNPHGSDTSSKFTFIPPVPVITSFEPAAATTGTPVHITGKNFKWITGVSFGNSAAASYIVRDDSTITAVPGNGSSGIISITNEFGTDTLGTFIFLEPNSIVAYPNPAIGYSTLAHPSTDHASLIKVISMNGKVMKTISVTNNEAQTRVDVSNVPPGIYKVVWTDGQTSKAYTILVQ